MKNLLLALALLACASRPSVEHAQHTQLIELGRCNRGWLFVEGEELKPPYIFTAQVQITGRDTVCEDRSINGRSIYHRAPQGAQGAPPYDPQSALVQSALKAIPVTGTGRAAQIDRMHKVAQRLSNEHALVDSARYTGSDLVVYWHGKHQPDYYGFADSTEAHPNNHSTTVDVMRVVRSALDHGALVLLTHDSETMVPAPLAEAVYQHLDSLRRGLKPAPHH
jgi:hypothetical protein